MAEELNPMSTTISCEQLSSFIQDLWFDILDSESVLEVETKLDMLEDGFGDSLAPCVGYEVLNGLTDEWGSTSKLLEALKADAKDTAQKLHREGKDGPGEDEKYTSAKFNLILKRIEQVGRDTSRKSATQRAPARRKAVVGKTGMWARRERLEE